MFNKMRLKSALVEYKKRFIQTQWPDEKYKWEAVKCFQVNWDVNADDFAAMLTKALSQTGNLLASVNNFPDGVQLLVQIRIENDIPFGIPDISYMDQFIVFCHLISFCVIFCISSG